MRSICAALVAAILSLFANAVLADVRLPRLIGNDMVIQRGAKFTVWGWAKPGEKVSVSIGDNKAQALAGEDGMWSCQLSPMEASDKPVDMIVAGNNTLTVKNVLVGDVWFCSGQSNMGLLLTSAQNGKEEAAKADHPTIRLFSCQGGRADKPQDDIKDYMWLPCNPKNAAQFSGVAYYFGRKLNEELKVPIGLIAAGYGGTSIEEWMPMEAFKNDKTLSGFLEKFASQEAEFPKLKEDWDKKKAQWEETKAKILATQPTATTGKGIPYPPNPIKPPSQMNCTLYNSTVAPLRRVSMAGVIWYQGENNVGDAEGYARMFPAMIRHWRADFGQDDLPFLFVQIADGATQSTAGDPNRRCTMSELRNAQLAGLSLPKTAVVVTLDCGEPNSSHPKYKKPVGERLARAAMAVKYGQNIPNYSSPLFDSMKVDGDKLIVKFKHAEGGLVAKGDKVTGFIIAGSDGKFFDADARIDGDGVILSTPKVPKPASVRYAWGLAPLYCLYNKADLPAPVFQAGEIDKTK